MLLNMTGVPRLVFRLMLDARVPLGLKLILPAAVVYLVSPLDIVPDILPALGRIDDVLVILIALVMFLGMAPRDVVAEHFRGAPANDRTRDGDGKVVEGQYRRVDDDDEEASK